MTQKYRECLLNLKSKSRELSQKNRKTLYDGAEENSNEPIQLEGKDYILDLYGRKGGYKKISGAHAPGNPCSDCETPIKKFGLLRSST